MSTISFEKDKIQQLFLIVILVSIIIHSVNASNQKKFDDKRGVIIEEFLNKRYAEDEPGLSILVSMDDRIILRKSIGMADLELGMRLQPDMIFRIGSVTKQFTAVGIMMLLEEKKLSLEDDFRKYLPDFPKKEYKITIKNLLNHTSGIKEFVGTKKWNQKKKQDLSVEEIIDLFKNEPLAFKPGDHWEYSDSGYVLLGAIIEKISKKPYAGFLQDRIFTPLGMKNTFADDPGRIIPNRVKGYHLRGKEYINAPYISMSWTYAGGIMASSVSDLYKWEKGITSGKLIKDESLEEMRTPVELNNGSIHGYGFGWGISSLWGRKVIEHTGRIEGFTSVVMSLPREKIFVAVLCNRFHREPDPSYIARWIATLLLGEITGEKTAINLNEDDLNEYKGVYQIGESDYRTVTPDGNRLFTMRTHGLVREAFCQERDKFFFKESISYFTFNRDNSGRVQGMTLFTGAGRENAVKTSKAPEVRKAIILPLKSMKNYAGKYKMSFGDIYLFLTADGLTVQLPGREPMEIRPRSETDFFFRNMDARILFEYNTSGTINGLTLIWGGHRMEGKKVQ